jgi:hypothetical protein
MQDLVDILLHQPNRMRIGNHIAAVLLARVLGGQTLAPVWSMGKRHWHGILAVALGQNRLNWSPTCGGGRKRLVSSGSAVRWWKPSLRLARSNRTPSMSA